MVGPSGFVGRVAELAAIDEFLAAAGSGFSVLSLTGEAGIGKTTLWLEGIRRAEERTVRVLVARPAEAEASLSFAGLSDLLSRVGDEVRRELPDPQRQALSAALLQECEPETGIDEGAVCAAVLSILRLLSAERPLVLGVDDAHWLDRSSARVLTFAARRLAAEPVGLLATHRVDGALPAFVDCAAPQRRETLEVGPLTVAALHESIKLQIGRSLPRPLVVEISRVSGGNPFYALEIARELARRPPERGRVPIPTSLSRLVEARVRRLPAATREALLAAAALSQPTVELVDPTALAAAEEAGMVGIERGRIRFLHPLFASAVYERASAPARRRLHRRLATLVSDSEERARHLALGSEGPDATIARQLDAAAADAAARGASDAAAELAELALQLTLPGHGERGERLFAAAGFQFRAGDLEQARILLAQLVGETPSGALRARALQMLGHVLVRRSDFVAGRKAALDALEAAEGDVLLRTEIELDLAFYCVNLGDVAGAEPHARAAVELAEEPGGGRLTAGALAVSTVVDFLRGHGFAEAQMTRALALDDGPHGAPLWVSPRFIHGLLLLWTGDLDRAIATLDALRLEAVQDGRESDVPLLFLYLVWACVWRGDLDGAAAFADQSAETAALLDDHLATALALSANTLVHAHRGPAGLAREEGERAIALFERLRWRAGTIWPLWALGLLELARGNPDAVDALLGPLSALTVETGLGDPVLGVFLPDEIEALVGLGRLDQARALVDLLEQPARRLDRPWAIAAAARSRALLHAAGGESGAAIAALHEALAEHERLDMPLERARTLLVLGSVLRRDRHRRRAREALTEALLLFERAGAHLWEKRAAAELGRLGLRNGNRLTETERQVAELAATGLSNREVAERAFLSVKGVEANLTRIYRKLGIRSRSGLARALEAAEPNDGI